ncbi:glutamate--cysteine ligase [Bremerella cremea]|uniref:Glutamate--cysteine ligase n=1 Tax=Blastopirellula marina TaxID=124 RepID=A0A2S8FVY8_9BACT|nr:MULTISPECIES: glutamate-cysteine ligase family protein [Pirellulaceae]PQO36220.1 glutamate--cysteine ligase [Blastopirellula marina]RCS48897.1 glutamate--cysteine ligase [Bremerella cremea]
MLADPVHSERKKIPLFEAFGVELEYMIVHENSLDVAPIADQLLRDEDGNPSEEIERDDIAWSNELALHVVELKTNGPVSSLNGLASRFQANVEDINRQLGAIGARLMPSAMHPWMRPDVEMKLWPHGYNEVYEAFNAIFNCSGHGWANLQSCHLNLPFANDDEFGRLHAAIRVLLPILPALTASSPVCERQLTPELDHRLETYRHNADRIPQVAGSVIPEGVFTQAAYEQKILQEIYDVMAPLDLAGVLRQEWVNSRGAIARFQRNTIEIRVMDVQEQPAADVAICQLVVQVLKALTDERWVSFRQLKTAETLRLRDILLNVVDDAEETVIVDPGYLELFGWTKGTCNAGQLWRYLANEFPLHEKSSAEALDVILDDGPLARRIVTSLSGDLSGKLLPVYRALCDCLATGRSFRPSELKNP